MVDSVPRRLYRTVTVFVAALTLAGLRNRIGESCATNLTVPQMGRDEPGGCRFAPWLSRSVDRRGGNAGRLAHLRRDPVRDGDLRSCRPHRVGSWSLAAE